MASDCSASDSNSNPAPPPPSPLPYLIAPPLVSFMVGEGEEEHEVMLPLGYRFLPGDHVLILTFLHNKILDRKLPVKSIREIDLYNLDPNEIPEDEFEHGIMDNEAYYFTQLDPEYTKNNSSQKRTTKNGFWLTVKEDESIVHDDEVIGFKKTLAFHCENNEPTAWSGLWLIDEYRVNPASSQLESLDQSAWEKKERYVLCRIKLEEDES